MTAPLRSSEPIAVPVALGARAYDIVIGRGLLARAERDRIHRVARPLEPPERRLREPAVLHHAETDPRVSDLQHRCRQTVQQDGAVADDPPHHAVGREDAVARSVA